MLNLFHTILRRYFRINLVSDCPFCNLEKRVVRENKFANLFLSNPRKVAGHFLVTPKRHVEKPWEITKEETQAIFDLVFFAQKRLAERVSEGSDVLQHYRPFMKQNRIKVNHIHYHILPRGFNDNLYQKIERHETEKNYEYLTDDERDEMEKVVL